MSEAREATHPPAELPEGWSVPQPLVLPQATYTPLVVAFGLTLMALGVVTMLVITLIGAVLFVGAIAHWVYQMLEVARSAADHGLKSRALNNAAGQGEQHHA